MRALRRAGRLVLMGSATEPVALSYGEVMANDWEIIGNFMYRPEAMRVLAGLVRAGQLDLGAVRVTSFPIGELEPAMDAAARVRGLDCTVMRLD